jgi:hypothetical protein
MTDYQIIGRLVGKVNECKESNKKIIIYAFRDVITYLQFDFPVLNCREICGYIFPGENTSY